MILNAFYNYIKVIFNKLNIVKGELKVTDKQDVIVITETGGEQSTLPDEIGTSEFTIVVLNKEDSKAKSISEDLCFFLNNKFGIILLDGLIKFKVLSMLCIKRPVSFGYNGYSYQYNVVISLRYAKI